MYPFKTNALPSTLSDIATKSSDAGREVIDPRFTGETIESRYDSDLDYVPNRDLQDTRANRQGTLEGVANITGRFLGKTGTRVLDGLAFSVAAPFSLIKDSLSGKVDSVGTAVSSVVDNPVSVWARDAEDWLDQQMPIYQTKAQDQSIDFTSLGFADKVANGLSYVAAMAAVARVGGGTGVLGMVGSRAIPKLIKMAGGSKNLGKIFGNAIEEGRDLNNITNLFQDVANLPAELSRINKLTAGKGAFGNAMSGVYGGIIESAAEASQTKEEVLQKLTQEQLQANNGQPLTAEQKSAINQQASEALAANFGVNLLTTGAANATVFHKLFNTKYVDDMTSLNKVVKNGDKYELESVANSVGKYQKLFQPVRNIANSSYIKGAVTEGAQELGQFASNDFFVNLYSTPDQDSVNKVRDTFGYLIEAGGETLGNLRSKDAMESMIIGGLIGAGFGGYLNRNDDAKKKANTERLINNANLLPSATAIKELARIDKDQAIIDGASANGDRVTFETGKALQVFNYVNSRDNLGRFSDVKAELADAKEMQINAFKEKYDIQDPDYNETKRDQFIDYISDIADKTKAAKTKLMTNYGHKLTELEKDNPDITGFLTMIDVLKEDYTKRENDLFAKLSPYMQYDEMIANRLTPEKATEFEQQISQLTEQAIAIQSEPATTAEQLTDRTARLTKVANQINTLQTTLAKSATEANYKEFLKIEGLNEEKTEKKAKEKTRYAEYTKDLNDFKQIQDTKERLIDYYSKIVNNVDYAKQVQQQINIANQSSLLENVFSLNKNIVTSPKIDKKTGVQAVFNNEPQLDYNFANPESGAKGEVQDYIKPGDIYNVYKQQTRRNDKTQSGFEDLDTEAPVEVVDTTVDIINNVPVGKIKVKDQRGKFSTYTANQFKTMIKPFRYNNEVKYKYDQESENVRLYRLFKDRAIKYDINGKEVVGMLGFSNSSYNAENLVLKYKDENGKDGIVTFKANRFKGDYSKGYVKVLSERETLAFQLNANAKGYANFLLKNIDSKNKSLGTSAKRLADLQQRLKSAEDNNNVLEKNAIQRSIKSYSNFIQDLENNKEVKQNAVDRLNQLETISLEPSEELGNDFNKIIDKVLEYTNAERALAENKNSEGRTPKQIKSDKKKKAYEIELDGETTTIDLLNTELDNLKQQFIDNITQQIDPTQAAEISNAELNPTLDLQYIAAVKYAEEANTLTDLATKIDTNQALVDSMNERVNEQVAQIEAEYTAQVLQATGLQLDDIKSLKVGELEAIAKFISFINRRGFFENTGKGIRKVQETGYKLPEPGEEIDFVTSRPSFIIKTTGNSENTDSLTKKEFYKNIHKLSPEEHKVRVVKPSEYKNLGLEGNEDAIFLAVTDLEGNDTKENGKNLVTTLPLNTLQDSFGFRFRNFETGDNLSPVKKEIGVAIDTALQSTTEFYSTLDSITDSLKTTHPGEVKFIDSVKEQLTDLQRLRETILANRDSDITINIAGKSNGIPKLSSNPNITSNTAFTSTGKIVIPESGDRYTSGDVSYRTTPGRAYFEDLKTRTFFPVTVDFIGNKNLISKNGKNTGISFVDNIVNGGKFVQAAIADNAKDYEGKNVDVKEAMSRVNNMLSYITYTNNNANKPDSRFEYVLEDSGVVFYIGSNTPLRLDTEEALIRELLAKKIFNVDRKSLEKDFIYFPTFKQAGEGYTYDSNKYNYQEFVKNNFGLKTNIIADKDGALYKNGYLILDKNPIIKKETKAEAGVSLKETKSSGKLAGLKNKQTATTSVNPDGTLSIVLPSSQPKVDEPVKKGLPKPANKKPNLKGASSLGAFTQLSAEDVAALNKELGNNFPDIDRKLTAGYYKGNVDNRMSPKQLEQARKKFFNNYGIEIEIVKGLIDNDAFGLVSNAGDLLISDRAPIGTDYHEEFHLVSQHILDRSQLSDIYSEWRTKNGQELTDDQVEEELAEAFRLRAQGYEGFTGKIKSVFDYLLSQIKKLLGLNTKQEQLFQDIYRGKYYGSTIYKGTKAYKSSAPTLDWDIRQKAFRGATQQLVYNMFDDFAQVNNITREEALNILATDKDARLDFLNQVDEEGISYYKYMIDNSFEQYYENVNDLVTAQISSYVTEDNYGDLLKEYTAFVSKELNLKGIEESDIDENTTGRDIVKKGDNEVDFFNEAVTQVRLLAYTQSDLSGNYPINPAALTKIYIDNLADSPNSQAFEETLGTLSSNPNVTQNFDPIYSTAIKNINELVGLNSKERTKSQQFMIGNLWSSFGKLSTDFRILKITDAEDGIGTDTRWIDASKEASTSSVKRDLTFTIKDNYLLAKNEIIEGTATAKGLTTVTNPEAVFEILYGIEANKFNSYNHNKIQSLVNAFARSKNVNDYLSNNGNDINVLTEYLTLNSSEKVNSFFNAGGKLQHSIQNPSSLFYRVRDNESNPEIMTINKIVNINGIQRTLSGVKNDKTADDVTEDDLHILFFNSFLKRNRQGSKTVMPFVFSGDKSTLSGIEITQGEKLLYANSVKDIKVEGKTQYVVDHSSIYEEYLKDELSDLEKIYNVGDSVKGLKQELPFFSFLLGRNPTLYNSIIKDVKNLKANKDTTENVFTRYKDEVLRETQDYFVQKGKDLEQLYKKIGFDYESVLKKNGIENQAYLNWYASAYAVGIQEQTKLVGSFAFYDEIAKRIPAWNGTKRPIRTDNDWVNWYNKSYNSNIDIADLRALTINDVEKQSDITLYDKNTPSDAQAYISLDAARFMLFSSGTYSYRLDDLFREIETYDKKQNLTAKDYENLNTYVTQLNEYMNVLKPQYYGMQDIGGLEVPTFYKFSVLPLSKAITQGRNLDNIRELMSAKGGPHIVMFDSANKVGRKIQGGGIDLYDKSGNYKETPLAEKLQSIQTSSWEGLGIQVDMPKTHENVTFGTQMRKLITVDLEGNYTLLNSYTLRDGKTVIPAGEVTSEQIRQINDDLIIEKLESDKKDLMDTLGLDESLTVTPDKVAKVKKELIRQANLRDVSNSFIQGIQALTSFDFLMNKSKLQQLVNSMVSKAVIKQTMTGDAKAMVSSVGFEKKNGGIQADKRLKFYKKGSREGSYMEVLLPLNMKAQYDQYLYFNADENLYMFKPDAPQEIQKLIGYRIPTQAPASIENIRIKGFYNGGYGNSVVVPFELTSKAGSDFDIDKLNLFMPKFKSNISDKTLATWLDKLPEEYFAEGMTKVEYYKEIEAELAEDLETTDIAILKFIRDNAEKTYKYDSKHIDNRIIQFYTDLMSSPTYFDNFVNSIDEDDFKKLAQKIGDKRGLKKSAKDVKASSNFYDPTFVVKMRAAFMNAKDTLGAAAIATTHHAESQKHKLAINSTTLSNGKSARIVKGGNTSATIGELLSLFQDNIVEDGKVRLDRIYNFENKKISGILSQFVNASVDVAKDEYITSANLDLETVGVASLLVRAGIPINKVFTFLSQPGIIKYTDALRKTKVTALVAEKKGVVRDRFSGGNYTKLTANDLTGLFESIQPDSSGSVTGKQADFVDLYKNLEEYAQLLTDLQQITTFDTKGTGSMLEENEINLFKYDTFVKNYSRMFSGLDSMLNDETSFTARMREEARNANNFNNSLFKLGEFYTPQADQIVNKNLNIALENYFQKKQSPSKTSYQAFKFKGYFNSYLLQRVVLSNNPNLANIVTKTIPQIVSFTGDNAFIKRLRTGDNKIFMHGGASIAADELNQLSEAFTELYRTPDTNQLAKDIILSGLVQFGVVNNPSTIMNTIPTTLLLDTLKLTSTDPLIEAYNKVIALDRTADIAITHAVDHTNENKGDNHFSNYVIVRPVRTPNTFSYANEKFNC